jgi:hypothetical protein
MTLLANSGTFTLGDRTVNRIGYGAMQLAGPGVFGPPRIVRQHWRCCAKLLPLA